MATSITSSTTTNGTATTAQPKSRDRHYIYVPTTLGAKASDLITTFVGSWLFVGIHAVWFIAWIVFRIEPFPYGLLTLLVSLEAIFLSTFVMMSQNRASERDHIRDDHEAEEVDLLYQINQRQLEILTLLRTNLCPEDAEKVAASLSAMETTLTQRSARKGAKTAPGGQPSANVAARPRANGASTVAQPATGAKVSGSIPRRRR